ncbi:hypothetical protein AGMMS50268_30670 [Spirochaetia bacterium]|nr:hypothetical protein AGMMS50268_30670 [Spirochaetia bacterium]
MKGIILAGGGAIFGCFVKDPAAYGVVEFDSQGKALRMGDIDAAMNALIPFFAVIPYDRKAERV